MTRQEQNTLEKIRAQNNLPALGSLVIRDGKIESPMVVGMRKDGSTDPALASDAFHLGSNTKAMTAALIGLLIDQGKLTLQTRLGDIVPTVPPAWRATTIELLLAHRAGLKRTEPKGTNLLYLHRFTGSQDTQRLRWMNERLREPPDETRGTYEYSNAGYVLLGIVAETLLGAPWETLLVERLWKPLGIAGGGLGAPPALWQHQEAEKKGTWTSLDPKEKVDNPPLMAPAGGVYLPLGEWAKFIALFADPENQALLRPATLRLLSAPLLPGTYGGGWIVAARGWAGGRALTHAGSNRLNFALAWVAPAKRFAVLVATNAYAPSVVTAADSVVQMQLERYLGRG